MFYVSNAFFFLVWMLCLGLFSSIYSWCALVLLVSVPVLPLVGLTYSFWCPSFIFYVLGSGRFFSIMGPCMDPSVTVFFDFVSWLWHLVMFVVCVCISVAWGGLIHGFVSCHFLAPVPHAVVDTLFLGCPIHFTYLVDMIQICFCGVFCCCLWCLRCVFLYASVGVSSYWWLGRCLLLLARISVEQLFFCFCFSLPFHGKYCTPIY